jgi:hypothetical protein
MVQPDRQQMAVRCMYFPSWVSKDTNTHLDYVILIAFFFFFWLKELTQCYVIHKLLVLLSRCLEDRVFMYGGKDVYHMVSRCSE